MLRDLLSVLQLEINIPNHLDFMVSMIGSFSLWSLLAIISCHCVILSTNKGVKQTVLFSHGLNKAFLVSDSCRATERNGNKHKRWRHRWRQWKRLDRRLFQLFSDDLTVVFDFLILQDKHNIRTLSLNIQLICTRCETG